MNKYTTYSPYQNWLIGFYLQYRIRKEVEIDAIWYLRKVFIDPVEDIKDPLKFFEKRRFWRK